MTTRRRMCSSLTVFLLGLVALAIPIAQVNAAFANLGSGGHDSGWEWESSGLTPSSVLKLGSTTYFMLTGTFTNMSAKTIRLKTRDNINDQDERFFVVDMTITNSTANNWPRFELRTIDRINPPPSPYTGTTNHPKWAHIHPDHSSPGDPIYTPYTKPTRTTGVSTVTLSGGTVPKQGSNVWLPIRIKLLDMYDGTAESGTGQMDFDFQLTPLLAETPEPSTLVLAVMGLVSVVGGMRRRRRRV